MRLPGGWVARYRASREPRFRPVPEPADSYSPWDQGWQLGVAWWASLMIVLLGMAHLALALEVLKWWIAIVT